MVGLFLDLLYARLLVARGGLCVIDRPKLGQLTVFPTQPTASNMSMTTDTSIHIIV